MVFPFFFPRVSYFLYLNIGTTMWVPYSYRKRHLPLSFQADASWTCHGSLKTNGWKLSSSADMTIYAGATILVAKSSPTSSPPPHSTCGSPATDQCILGNRKGQNWWPGDEFASSKMVRCLPWYLVR